MLKDPSSGCLSHKFVLVANIEAADGGAAIAAGNGRVVQARLSDAKFFWETDLKVNLEDRLEKLDQIVFHEKLGTQGARAKRLAGLAREIAPYAGAEIALAERAARLAARAAWLLPRSTSRLIRTRFCLRIRIRSHSSI